jgi:uncharacterized protein (DUF2236 family)
MELRALAYSSAVRDSNSNPTTRSSPTTQASWPGSMTYACPGAMFCYGRFVRGLTREDEERYYREMSIVAHLFGTPASVIPRSLTACREYLSSEFLGPTLSATEPARKVAAVVFEADLPR